MKTEFEPGAYLRKVSGKDYLEVKWRLVWLRDKHPDASLETELVQLDLDKEFAIFRARVVIPGGGDATGYGSETKRDFTDFIEKGETKAVGRALAALGFGTQFCDDFEAVDASGVTHVADSPVEKPAISGKAVSEKQESQPQGATNAQMQMNAANNAAGAANPPVPPQP